MRAPHPLEIIEHGPGFSLVLTAGRAPTWVRAVLAAEVAGFAFDD